MVFCYSNDIQVTITKKTCPAPEVNCLTDAFFFFVEEAFGADLVLVLVLVLGFLVDGSFFFFDESVGLALALVLALALGLLDSLVALAFAFFALGAGTSASDLRFVIYNQMT